MSWKTEIELFPDPFKFDLFDNFRSFMTFNTVLA